MHTFQGIAVNAGASIGTDCQIAHTLDNDGIEINMGSGPGGLSLCLSGDAAVRLVDVMTAAVADLRQRRTTSELSERPHDEE